MSGHESAASLLQAVAEVGRVAGDFAMRHYRTDVEVITKGDGSPVTIADRGGEEAARRWIEERFPLDGILGEEFGETRPDARRRWILDPVDGTKSFVRGAPLWGTLVAVAEGDTVLAGCAYFPAVGELVCAAPGEGCWWNDRRASVSPVATLSAATVLATDERMHGDAAKVEGWRRLAGASEVARTWGDAYGYLLVATGRAEVMVDPIMNPWDAAAVLPIITEAGGVFSDWRGRATAFGGDSVATNARLAEPARALLGIPLP